MFTGIVAELGEIVAAQRLADSARLTVRGRTTVPGLARGESVAVDGTCLTVTDLDGDTFTADVMRQTLQATTLGRRGPGDPVNLERPIAAGAPLGGHVVQGHVDGVATVLQRRTGENWDVLRIGLDPALARYLVARGSIAVDGVSLTVSQVHGDVTGEITGTWFEVALIPETLRRTTLGRRAVGDAVNLEVDVLAKYVERLLTAGAGQ